MAAGVDDARFAQHLELLRRARHRPLAVLDRPLQHLGEDRVLLLFADVAAESLFVGLEVGELAGQRVGHLAEDGQHRPLGGLAHRVVGGVGGGGEGGGDQHRVDQLAGPAGELLGGAADDLAEDHAGVAAGAHQRRPGQGLHQLGAADLVDRRCPPSRRSSSSITARSVIAMLSPVSPSATGKTLRSLTSCASRLQRGECGADDPPEAGNRWIGHSSGNLSGRTGRATPVAGEDDVARFDEPRSPGPLLACPRRDARFATWITGHRKTVIFGWIVALIVIGAIAGIGRHQLHRRIQTAGLRLDGSLRTARNEVPGAVRRHRADRLQGRRRGRIPGGRRRRWKASSPKSKNCPRQRSRQPLRRRRRRGDLRRRRNRLRDDPIRRPGNKLNKDDTQSDHQDRAGRRRRRARSELGGQPIEEAEQKNGDSSFAIGLLAAIIILLLAFGSVVAMGLPIITALLALGVGLSLVTLGT